MHEKEPKELTLGSFLVIYANLNDRLDGNIFLVRQLQYRLIIGLLQVDDLIVLCAYDRMRVVVGVDEDHISLHAVAQGNSVIEV